MWRYLAMFASLCLSVGCVSQEVYRDQDRMREVLLDLYTNQIMDNLIRAKQGLPIVQVDYDKAFAQVTLKETTPLSDSGAFTNSSAVAKAAAKTVTTFATGVNTLIASGTLDHTNQVSVASAPAINVDAVYDAYAEFLSYGDSLQVSRKPVPDCMAHICRRVGHEYYWVPLQYQKQFLYLALVTTAQRGQGLVPLDPFYTITLTQIIEKTDLKQDVKVEVDVPDPMDKTKTSKKTVTKKNYRLLFQIDQSLPYDTGRISIADPSTAAKNQDTNSTPGKTIAQAAPKTTTGQGSSAKSAAVFEMEVASRAEIASRPDGKGRSLFSDRIFVTFNEQTAPSFMPTPEALISSDVLPVSAKVYLRRHRPQPVSQNGTLDRIDFQLQQIQLNQQRNNTSP